VIGLLPPVDAEFGVVVAATPEHLHWAKGAFASVRYFMDDTPICLILDGEADTRGIERACGARVIRRAEVDHPELVRLSMGSIRAKNTPLWLAPFETFLFLDADAVVWGDMREHADFEQFDFILDKPIGDPKLSRKFAVDPDAASLHFPDFDAHSHVGEYANAGVYLARRGLLDVERYLELVRFWRQHPGVFYGDQGLLNFLVFNAADEGRLRLGQRELQVTTGDTAYEVVARRFAFTQGRPSVRGAPGVLHWAGSPKPRVRTRERDHFEPMTFFRREFRAALRGGRPSARDGLRLRWEDVTCSDFRGSNLRGRVRMTRRRASGSYRELKRTVRAHVPDSIMAALGRRAGQSVEHDAGVPREHPVQRPPD
jgi:hypothetical protein